MKMLKTKHFRRIVVFLAMIAPAVYLFGSLFAGLTGAHGSQVFADSGSNVESVSYSFERFYGTWFNGTDLVPQGSSFLTSSIYPYPSDSTLNFKVDSDFADNEFRVVFYDGDNLLSSTNRMDDVSQYSFVLPAGADNFKISLYSSLVSVSNFYDYPLYLTSSVVSPNDYYSAVGFSDYIFGQFFAQDNFLVDIGKDVLSDNPHGFTPFASFWKYLDDNMLHMGDMQLGLMGYGYVYYCCHVLLFDIAFILVTFFLDFIQKVNDKVVGGVD